MGGYRGLKEATFNFLIFTEQYKQQENHIMRQDWCPTEECVEVQNACIKPRIKPKAPVRTHFEGDVLLSTVKQEIYKDPEILLRIKSKFGKMTIVLTGGKK